ncbi:hypothetical protein KBD34_04330 [Patescibacteria group bacterium]|nr:hypothetical protein [Patescibacteria group bacterium]
MTGMLFSRFFRSLMLAVLALSLAVPVDVLAATVKKPAAVYAASVIALGVPRSLPAGGVDQVRVTIKNLGNTTWKRDGKNYVSLYRWNPTTKKEIPSAFARPSWETNMRPVRLPVAEIASGKEVSFAFPVRAPDLPGIYKEQFILASEDVAWIARSTFDVELNVVAAAGVPSAPITTPSSPSPITPATVTPASVTASSDWKAELVDKGGIEWQLEPGDRSLAEVAFRNTGSSVWTRTTGAFVSVYAVDATGKKERTTPFVTGAEAKKPVARLLEEQVLPGGIGHFKLQLRGAATPGFYREQFALAAENAAWLEGGVFTLPIRVPGRDEFVGTAPPDSQPLAPSGETSPSVGGTNSSNMLFAALTGRSENSLSGAGYTQKQFVVTYKNVSSVPWKNPSIRFIDLRRPSYSNDSSLQDASWSNTNEAVRLLGATPVGESLSLAFTFRLPADQGAYTALFQLYVDGQPTQGGIAEIPLNVTSNASIRIPRTPTPTPVTTPTTPRPTTPVTTNPPIQAIPLNGDVNSLPAEPMIRVGVLRTVDDRSVIQAMTVPVLVQQAGSTLCRLSPGQQTSVRFDRTSRVYILEGSCTGQSSSYYIFRAEDNLSPMRVSDYDRNDNTFRAQLELRYAPATDSVWLINELPIEWYLKGIAETSNISPSEFQRTLLTTARTYAMYHVQRGTKHADEYYTVDARYDQVYRGYGAEARTPTISAAVDATRGQIVTYQGRLAITPYFSRSDGRTRGWGEVWGGGSSYPWLVSVPVPQDQGRTLWGHGVGMSATGALDMANEGKLYTQILSHFYQGTELRRAYR